MELNKLTKPALMAMARNKGIYVPSKYTKANIIRKIRNASGPAPQPKTPQPKTAQPKTPQPKTAQPKTPQPATPNNNNARMERIQQMIKIGEARNIYQKLGLNSKFFPMNRIGGGAFGNIYKGRNETKIMKISNMSTNSKSEMSIAKIAGTIGIGPRVYNTHIINGKAVITMNYLKNAKTVARAIMNGEITNWKPVQSAINRMHKKGIHHGDLHTGNIIIYTAPDGTRKIAIIDFGAAIFNPKIKNVRSAERIALGLKYFGRNLARKLPASELAKYGAKYNYPLYQVPGRSQVIVKNSNRIKESKEFLRSVLSSRKSSK